jgi:asparagine synthase (glutamine-hydrolysing)
MNLPLYERLTRWSSLFYDDVEQLLSSELLASIRPIERVGYLSDEIEHAEGLSPLTRLLRANFVRYLLDDLLVKTDRCSMACALEARSPFLDRELVEYVMALPDNFKLRRGRNKVILRDACADLVPREIARRGKMGFGVPLGAWFRGELREYLDDYLLSRDAAYRSYLSPEFVAGLVRRHREGPVDLSLQLWSLLTFEIWLRQLPGWVAERRAEARTRADSASYESFELLPGRP